MTTQMMRLHLTDGTVLDMSGEPEEEVTLAEAQKAFARYVRPEASLWGVKEGVGSGFLVASEKIQYIEFFGFKREGPEDAEVGEG